MSLAAVLLSMAASAAETKTYTVAVVYDGTKATVTIPQEISNYVSCPSGESSHVKLIQTSTTTVNPGEIIYSLKGETNDGEFYFIGEYKATLKLDGLTLANPDSSAVHIKDGKRIKVSITDKRSTPSATAWLTPRRKAVSTARAIQSLQARVH